MENTKDSQNKKRLGRGIGSLLGGSDFDQAETTDVPQKTAQPSQPVTTQTVKPAAAPVAAPAPVVAAPAANDKRVWSIAVDKLVPGVYQPRRNFSKQQLEELAISIKENGIIQPLTVRKRQGGGYEIIAGERRWRAAQVAGLHEVPAIIKEYTDKEALEIALIENVQREDLDPIEEAEGYQRLMNEFTLSQQQVAEKVGKERSTVANALRLIALPQEIKNMIVEGLISSGHAKAILGIEDKKAQLAMAKSVAEKQLSVRALEALVKKSRELTQSQAEEKLNQKDPLKADLSKRLAHELSDQLQKTLGTKVEINYKNGKGSLTIHFYSDEQLNTVYEKLK